VATEREVFIDLELSPVSASVVARPPPVSYAITLEVLERAEWTTVRLWDNADDVDQHHEHAYTRSEGKQPATIIEFKSSNDAMAAAIRKAKAEAAEIVSKMEGGAMTERGLDPAVEKFWSRAFPMRS
jgi:hypothetical protein